MTHCSLRYAPFHFPAKGSVITYFPSGVRLHGELLGWTLLVGWCGGGGGGGLGGGGDLQPTESGGGGPPVVSCTRNSLASQQHNRMGFSYELKVRQLQKQKALSVSLSRLVLSLCIKQTAHKMIGLTFGPNLQPGEAFLKSDFLNVSVS